MMRSLVPSYSVGQEAISDEASIIRPAKPARPAAGQHAGAGQRQAPPSRRHHRLRRQWAFLRRTGPDIGPIPTIALKQVQVLRDGAAAQYGSDAIAGVIDYELKDSTANSSVEAKFGEFYKGDGTSYSVAGNLGLPLGDCRLRELQRRVRPVGSHLALHAARRRAGTDRHRLRALRGQRARARHGVGTAGGEEVDQVLRQPSATASAMRWSCMASATTPPRKPTAASSIATRPTVAASIPMTVAPRCWWLMPR